MQENFKYLKMLYHSNLRNVGTFTSIALSILVYARYFKEKSFISNILFISIGLIFLFIATYLNIMLIGELNNAKEIEKDKKIIDKINKMFTIPYIIISINFIIFFFTFLIKIGKI